MNSFIISQNIDLSEDSDKTLDVVEEEKTTNKKIKYVESNVNSKNLKLKKDKSIRLNFGKSK